MRKVMVLGLLVAVVLAACAAPAASNDTAELQSQVTALQGQVTTLQGQVTALETQAAAAEEEHMAAAPFDVAVAQYVLNTAGFHGMAEAIADTQTIDPSYGGTVTRVKTILSQTAWPAELQAEETAFIGLLDDFSATIAADDGAAAVEASDKVHEAQHAFSDSIDTWLGTASAHTHGN